MVQCSIYRCLSSDHAMYTPVQSLYTPVQSLYTPVQSLYTPVHFSYPAFRVLAGQSSALYTPVHFLTLQPHLDLGRTGR
jgi:hypothetical protein